MEKLVTNYHTHTKRCGHAYGEDEDFVLSAIKYGIKELGFSDHISFKNISAPYMRQDRSMLSDYISSISHLKEKYKDKIKIHLGFEAEYIEEYVEDYKDLLENHSIEYMICGQHCFIKDNKQVFYNSFPHDEKMIEKYGKDVVKAIQSGLFKYIAHPDLFMNAYRVWDDKAKEVSRKIIEEALKYNVPLEINCNAIRYHYEKHKVSASGRVLENYYPCVEFWKMVKDYGALGIIGVDAHIEKDFLDGVTEEALFFAKQNGIKLVSFLDIESKI